MELGKSRPDRSKKYCSGTLLGNNILKRSTVNRRNFAKSPNEM